MRGVGRMLEAGPSQSHCHLEWGPEAHTVVPRPLRVGAGGPHSHWEWRLGAHTGSGSEGTDCKFELLADFSMFPIGICNFK